MRKKRLVQRKQDENLNNVTFYSSVSKEMIPSILKQAHVGLLSLQDLPLYQWGFSPNKLYDYMAAGLPIALLSNLDNTPIERYSIGINASTINSMADAIALLKGNTVLRENMGTSARKYVENYNSWRNLSQKLSLIMQEDVKD
ncbi:hypothetical protein ACFQBN_16545 [Cohnella cellulosilytica]